MIKRALSYLLIIALGYILFVNDDSKYIVAGVGIFIIGMHFMEDGFKLFSGGLLEKLVANSTNTILKSVTLGVVTTAVLQSSSLIAIIVISFLSAKLITLAGAIGVVFGSAVGTTATAWIVSAFGLKINIAGFALPMVIFGVIFRFYKQKSIQGIGNILLGLGFVFLGIGYMKDGFEDLKQGIDLAQYAIDGYKGVVIYALVGVLATIILQSSSATLALAITALATGQIIYLNAIAIAIGANVGTTITAAMGAMVSNANSKRMALALFIFKFTTAVITIIFVYYLLDLVEYLADVLTIKEEDWAMKLALFHTIFNFAGLVVFSFFIHKLVKFLKKLFVQDVQEYVLQPKFLDMQVVEVPQVAYEATKKETIHLYDNASEVLSHAIMLHRHRYLGKDDIALAVETSTDIIPLDIDEFYQNRIKSLYSDIIDYSTYFINELDDNQRKHLLDLRSACRDIAEAVKDTKDLQKNIAKYLNSNNEFIKQEYNYLRIAIAKTMNTIHEIKSSEDELTVIAKAEVIKDYLKELDVIASGRIDELIRNKKIDKRMATSLLNDSANSYNIINKLINVSKILWIEDMSIKQLGEEQ